MGPSFCSLSVAQRQALPFVSQCFQLGSSVKPRASQRCRNILLSDAINGLGPPANIVGKPLTPPPCRVPGWGGPPSARLLWLKGGAPLPLAFSGSKACDLLSRNDFSRERRETARVATLSQQRRLSLKQEMGPANFQVRRDPPHHAVVRGAGVGPALFCSLSVAQRQTSIFRLAMFSIGSSVKPRASQRCRNILLSDAKMGPPGKYCWQNRLTPPPCRVPGAGGAPLPLAFSGSKAGPPLPLAFSGSKAGVSPFVSQ